MEKLLNSARLLKDDLENDYGYLAAFVEKGTDLKQLLDADHEELIAICKEVEMLPCHLLRLRSAINKSSRNFL